MENKIQKTKAGQVLTLEEKQQKDLVLYSPNNCYKHSNKLKTIKDAINSKSKTLGDFKRDYGRDWVIAYLTMWIIELNDNANVKQKMSDGQIEMTAERIFDTYSLKVADLTLFFRNVKDGYYGPYYENLSRDKIMQWISDYFNERCEVAQMSSQSGHDKFSMTKDPVHPKVAKNLFKGIGEEKIIHNHKTSGIGLRMKNELDKNLINTIENLSREKLENYLDDVCKGVDGICDIDSYRKLENEFKNRNIKINNKI